MELITAVHDAEVQGRGCHPRSQAMGFTCWTHIGQCPLGLWGTQLSLHSVSSSSKDKNTNKTASSPKTRSSPSHVYWPN